MPEQPVTTTIYVEGREYPVTETSIIGPRVLGGEFAPGATIRLTRVSPGGLIVRELYRIEKDA
jgi:hypothetical protein